MLNSLQKEAAKSNAERNEEGNRGENVNWGSLVNRIKTKPRRAFQNRDSIYSYSSPKPVIALHRIPRNNGLDPVTEYFTSSWLGLHSKVRDHYSYFLASNE